MKQLLILLAAFIFIACNNTTKKDKDSQGENSAVKAEYSNPAFPNLKEMRSVEKTMEFLSSDDLLGRNTGSEGIEKAAQFIEARFESVGVTPYFKDSFRDNFVSKGRSYYDSEKEEQITAADLEAFNVIGMVEGSDPELKKEIVLIGAHYDHIGIGRVVENDSIANGANDNAAGTTAVLALADYFAKAKTNKRTVVFALFSAEEKGLQGSQHLAERMKVEGANLYTMFNIEMIGIPMVDKDHLVYISGFDKSNIASTFNEYAGQKIIGFLPKAKEMNLFLRSDNLPFFEQFNIPAHTISSFDFTNFDHYHGVGDEMSAMDIPFMEKVIKAIIPGIEGMTNSEDRVINLVVEVVE